MGGARDLFDKLRRGQFAMAERMQVPSEHVTGPRASDGPATITSRRDYFTITVDSMRLAADRVWAKTYDPLVLAVTEFLYAGDVRQVPFVVGAPLITSADRGVPAGMTYANTVVAGPHPYYGQLAVTVILYRIERLDYLRRVLDAVQKTCAAFDLAGSLSAYLKVGEAVLDGLDAVFGQGQSEAVLGHRIELSGDVTRGTFAVLPRRVDESQLWADEGGLRLSKVGDATRLEDTSYVTYTIAPSPPVDLETLPWFTPLWRRIVQWANIPNDEAKEVAKNYLAALYEEIATSPDVARDAADGIYAAWEQRAHAIHAAARQRTTWSAEQLQDDPLRARALAIRQGA